MNQPKNIYESDLCQRPWFENNFGLEIEEFCSPDNIDDCLKYISQEFSDLGYPSFYAVPNTCPYSVNCDIVKLLNTIFEILKDFKEHGESKEELDNRNRRLASDLNVLEKKNCQLKDRIEQTERKLNSSLERERQLKVKNEQLQNILKNEKDESKKLSAQIQQQKVVYQREIRKIENNLTQMKTKLNQVLADKNPDKKIANISMSRLLQRTSNQRGKWKTGSLAKSSTDEMYNSVISTYENRCKVALKELEECRQCLQFIEQQLESIPSYVKDNTYHDVFPCLSAILNGNNIQKELIQKFSAMFTHIQNIIANKTSDNTSLCEEVKALKSEILNLKNKENISNSKLPKDNFNGTLEKHQSEVFSSTNDERLCEGKEEKNMNEQIELAATLAQIKEEKSKLEAQKLMLVRSAIKQSSSNSPQCSNSVPSFCILTTKNGITSVPATHQLKQCLSDPLNTVRSMSPLWKVDILSPSQSSSSYASLGEDSISSNFCSFSSPHSLVSDSQNDDLPNWARAATNITISDEDSINLENSIANIHIQKPADISSEDINLSVFQSPEEDNLAKLKAAAEDIESRRHNLFSKGK